MVQRLTYRKRHSYATKSNQHRVVKTPGKQNPHTSSFNTHCDLSFCAIDCDDGFFVSCLETQVGSSFIRARRRGQADPSALLLERGFRG